MTDDVTLARWQALLRYVAENPHSDFYRRRFAAAGFDPARDFASLADVAKVPLLARAEVAAASERGLLMVPDDEVEGVSATSGTSSGAPMLIYKKSNPDLPPDSDTNIPPGRRPLILMAPLRTAGMWSALHDRKQFAMMGDIHNLPVSLALAGHAALDAVYTTPTLAIILKKYLAAEPRFAARLTTLYLTGEVLTPAKKAYLHELYPNLSLYARFGSVETSLIGVQCEHLAQKDADGVRYHTRTERTFIEVVDPESGAPAALGTEGELVATSFSNLATPLIRYRMGDRVSFLANDCPCGAPGPLLEVHGRAADDRVRAGGFELKRDMVEAALLRLSDAVRTDFEARVRERYVGEKPRLKVTLSLALQDGVADTPGLRARIAEALGEYWRLAPTLKLKDALAAGLFEPVEITFVEFPRSAKVRQKLLLD